MIMILPSVSKLELQPFPILSKHIREKFSVLDRLELRPFGCKAEDLEIDFSSVLSPPTLVTMIIQTCTVSKDNKIPPEDFFWNLPIGQRIECLIKIVTSESSQPLVTILTCKEKLCKEKFELSLLRDNILDKDKFYNEDFCTVNLSGHSFKIKRPTGVDQLSWLTLNKSDQDILKRIIADLIDRDADSSYEQIQSIVYENIDEISRNMSMIDPLIDYHIELKCPSCGIKNVYEIDLEKLSLKRLRESQKELLKTVHALALAYHWTEQEILAIPLTRRKLYHSMLESSIS